MWISHRKEIRKLTFRALALRRRANDLKFPDFVLNKDHPLPIILQQWGSHACSEQDLCPTWKG